MNIFFLIFPWCKPLLFKLGEYNTKFMPNTLEEWKIFFVGKYYNNDNKFNILGGIIIERTLRRETYNLIIWKVIRHFVNF